MSTPQNSQTHWNNASDVADELFECDYFVVLALRVSMHDCTINKSAFKESAFRRGAFKVGLHISPTHLQLCLIHVEAYSGTCQTSKIEYLAEIVNGLSGVNYFHKMLHVRCLKGFWISLCFQRALEASVLHLLQLLVLGNKTMFH